MGYLKTLLSKDIIITPFRVHKQFIQNTIPEFSTTEAVVLSGSNIAYPLGGGEEGTGSKSLVYNSIKQLYYSNYLSGSGKVSNVNEPIINPDGTIVGSIYNPSYENNIQSITESRYFPTASDSKISVLSIPSKQFGEYIKPGSFSSKADTGATIRFTDDGQGNIISGSTGRIHGNILYESGLVIFTGETGSGGLYNFTGSQWESTVTIYETQYKCTIRANEYNYSLNPSLLSASIKGQNKILTSGDAKYSNFVTSSDFSPYVTTIGLYDEEQNLLAVGKLGQPLPTSQTTDTTILINIDR